MKLTRQLLFLLFLPFMFSCVGEYTPKEIPQAIKGNINLREWDFEKNGTLLLSGDWEFYWNSLLSPEDFKNRNDLKPLYFTMPSTWNNFKIEGKKIEGKGFATFRLVVDLEEKDKLLALSLFPCYSSYKIWVNGVFFAKNGTVGTSSDSSKPQWLPIVKPFKANGSQIEIIMQISNFSHIKGGLYKSIELGTSKKVSYARELNLGVDLMAFGCLLLIGLFFLGMYFFWNNDKSLLYFALFCIVVSYRFIGTGTYLIINVFPEIPWNVAAKAEYLSMYLAAILMMLFIDKLFPKVGSQLVMRSFKYITVAVVSLTVFFSLNIYIQVLFYYQIALMFYICYGFYVCIRAYFEKDEGAVFAIIGIVVLLITTIVMILSYMEVIPRLYFVFQIGFLTFVFSQTFIFSFRFAKAFHKVESLKEELLLQKNSIEGQHAELVVQKNIIDKKNSNITASITYAERIQQASLPQIQTIQAELEDLFVLFKPKDIVSGDFYWFSKLGNKIVIAAVDCTGHGVPGAFMSLVGVNLLSTIVNENNITEADLILNELDKRIKTALRQDITSNRDGMDVALCVIDKMENKLDFSGARNSLIYIQNGELFRIKGDKKSIGDSYATDKFTKHTVSIEEISSFYMFTDGYQDQFGGENDTKFMVKNMMTMFLENHQLSMEKQGEVYEEKFTEWKKSADQIDDILVIGFGL